MPLVMETDQPKQAKRGSRAGWLPLLPPVLGLALLFATIIQPLQLGPYVLATSTARLPGFGWKAQHVRFTAPPSGITPVPANGQPYLATGEVHALVLHLGDYGVAFLWFRGQRRR